MTYANNLNPDEAPQNVGLHLRSKLFDIQIIDLYQQNIWEEKMIFCIFWKKKNIWKNYPACKESMIVKDLKVKSKHDNILYFHTHHIIENIMWSFLSGLDVEDVHSVTVAARYTV